MLEKIVRSACFAAVAVCGVYNLAFGMNNKNEEGKLPDLVIDTSIGESRPYPVLGFYKDEKDNKKKPYYYWSDTKERATLEEVLERKGLKDVKLPSTPEEFEEYKAKHYAQSEDDIIDNPLNEFWFPIDRVTLELRFFCMEGRNPSVLFPQIRGFCSLLGACKDEKFKRFLFDFFFDYTGIGAAHMVLASCPNRCDLTIEDLFIDLLRDEFNSILDSIDPDKKYINWRFSSEYK